MNRITQEARSRQAVVKLANKKESVKKIMLELHKVKLIAAPKNRAGCRLLNPPTKIQKEILSLLNLSDDTFQAVCYDFLET